MRGGGRGGAKIIPPITEERVNDSVTGVLRSCKLSCDQLGWGEEVGRIYVWVGFVVDLKWLIGVGIRGNNRAA